MVLTGRCEVRNNLEYRHTYNRWEELYGEKYNGLTVKMSELIEPFVYGMWVVTYKTSLLREHMFTLPEHMLYTDRLYVCYPLPFIKTIAFQNYDVYYYRVGDEEQSVSVQSRINHWKESIEGFRIMLEFYSNLQDISAENMNFLNSPF